MDNTNPFNLTFGIEPYNIITRIDTKETIVAEFESDFPPNLVYLITGVRGSGKTVMLSSIANHFAKKDDWLVIDPGPQDNILENIAAEIYEAAHMKKWFVKKEFSFSFHGLSFSLKGETPVSSIMALLKKMLDFLNKMGIKLLITIDEVAKTDAMKYFIQAYQSLIRQGYLIRLLMTGLYSNVSRLQDDKSLTFLYRAPKMYMGALSLSAIAANYERLLSVDEERAKTFAKLTKGFPYAYQVLGYLLFQKQERELTKELLQQYDQYLATYVYDKVYYELSGKEQEIIRCFTEKEVLKTAEIIEKTQETSASISMYRDRLIKGGILSSPSYGHLELVLPRLKEYLRFKE